MVQTGIFNTKINKFVDREKFPEENLKRAFTILNVKCTESVIAKLGEDSKYESIDSNQDIIEIM